VFENDEKDISKQDKETKTEYINNYDSWLTKLEEQPYLSPIDCCGVGIEYEPGSYLKNFQKGNDEERKKQYEFVAPLIRAKQKKYDDYIAFGKKKEQVIKEEQAELKNFDTFEGFDVRTAMAKNPAFKKAMNIALGRKDPKKQGPADPKKMAKFLEDMKNGFENNKGEEHE
jgi:hypothetical protein